MKYTPNQPDGGIYPCSWLDGGNLRNVNRHTPVKTIPYPLLRNAVGNKKSSLSDKYLLKLLGEAPSINGDLSNITAC